MTQTETFEQTMAELEKLPIVASYKVIADYPGNDIRVGEIINLRKGPDRRFHTGDHIEPYAFTDNGAMTEYRLKQYPHLYQKI